MDDESDRCKQSDIDRLFIALNAEHGSCGKGEFNHKLLLNRQARQGPQRAAVGGPAALERLHDGHVTVTWRSGSGGAC